LVIKIVIIGGDAAGMSAAAKAKRVAKDAQIVVYEKTDIVSFGACGLPYFVGDFFEDPSDMMARTAEKSRESGLEINLLHEAVRVDIPRKLLTLKNLTTGEERVDSYDRLLIATGATPIIPPIQNVGLKNVFTLKSIYDGIDLKQAAKKQENKEVVIIGAGFIGLELVEAMLKLGKNVRLIQLDSRILPEAFDQEITDIMEKELIDQGVHLHLVEKVLAFQGQTTITDVVTDKGTYKADIVILATGIRPSTAFLKDTGIEMLRNGAIVIDKYGETNLKDVYAAGDCATVFHLIREENVYIPLATTANKLGRIVGENLAGQRTAFQGTLGSAAVKVMDLEAGKTGLSEIDAMKMGLNYKTVFVTDQNQTGYYPGQADIAVKLIYESETHVLLGGQIIGKKGAVLRVDVLAAAIFKKTTTKELGMLDLCYSPPFSKAWDVLNIAGNNGS